MILLDANVLVYAVNVDAPQHPSSRAVVEAALAGQLPAVLVPQVLLEFLAVITHPRRVANPLDPARAWQEVATLLARLPVLDPGPGALGMLGQFVGPRRPIGPAIFDLFLVAQMRSHGVATICTYNTADFVGIPGIDARTPDELLLLHGLAGTSTDEQ